MTALLAFLLFGTSQDTEFVRELMKKKKSTVGDAVLCFYSLSGEEKPAKTAKEAADALIKKGWIDEDWKGELDTNASLGEVCRLICAALEIKGGLTMRVLGRTSRYCYRECAAKRLVAPNGPHSAVSGRDLLSIVGRIEEEMEKREAAKK